MLINYPSIKVNYDSYLPINITKLDIRNDLDFNYEGFEQVSILEELVLFIEDPKVAVV